MKIQEITVNWNRDFDNRPTFEIVIDKFPDKEKYKKVGNFYLTETEDGYVNFFYYEKPGNGYAGRTFNITLEDETVVALKGPWSSRAGVINQIPEFPLVVDCAIKESKGSYSVTYSGNLTLKTILEHYKGQIAAVSNCSGEVTFEPVDFDGELKARMVNGIKRKIEDKLLGIIKTIDEARKYIPISNKKLYPFASTGQATIIYK